MKDNIILLKEVSVKIADTLCDSLRSNNRSGALLGNTGLCLLYVSLVEGHNKEYCSSRIQSILNNVITSSNEEKKQDWSFGKGLSGFGWVLKYLFRRDLIADPSEHIAYLTNPVYLNLKHDIFFKNFDLFAGANGTMLFCIEGDDPKKIESIVSYYLHGLIESAVYDNYGIKWLGRGYRDNSKIPQTNVFNLGIPHGMAGSLLLLLKIMKLDKERVTLLVSKMMDSFIHRIELDNKRFLIPNMIFEDGSVSNNTVLGWCYGPVSIGYALLKAALLTNNAQVRMISLNLLKKTLSMEIQFNGNEHKLSLCHGFTSIAYLYYKVFTLVEDQDFLNKSHELASIALQTICNQFDDPVFFSGFNPDTKNSLMYGLPGTLVSLLTILDGRDSSWDNALLL
jgi:lantibiotic modifying enzyme